MNRVISFPILTLPEALRPQKAVNYTHIVTMVTCLGVISLFVLLDNFNIITP